MSLSTFSQIQRTGSAKQITYPWISPTRGVSKPLPLPHTFQASKTLFERTKVPQSKPSQIPITVSTQQVSIRVTAQSTKHEASETPISWT